MDTYQWTNLHYRSGGDEQEHGEQPSLRFKRRVPSLKRETGLGASQILLLWSTGVIVARPQYLTLSVKSSNNARGAVLT